MATRVEAEPIRFDISQENGRAYRGWIRQYRLMLIVGLAVLIGIGTVFAAAFAASPAFHSRLQVVGYLPLAFAYVIIASLSALLVYAAFWLYQRGPNLLTVSSEGLEFEFDHSKRVRIRWAEPSLKLRVSRVEFGDPTIPGSRVYSAAVQSLRYPHIELSQPALDAILSAARAMNLRITESSVASPGDRRWDRIVIRGVPR